MGQATPSPSKVSDQMKYMNITFNNNKIKNENNPKLKTKANVYS